MRDRGPRLVAVLASCVVYTIGMFLMALGGQAFGTTSGTPLADATATVAILGLGVGFLFCLVALVLLVIGVLYD